MLTVTQTLRDRPLGLRQRLTSFVNNFLLYLLCGKKNANETASAYR